MAHRNVCLLREGEEIHPAGFRIKVEVDIEKEDYEQSKSGLFIAKDLGFSNDQIKKSAERGVLTEVGPLAGSVPGESLEAWGIDKIGQHVTFTRYEGAYFETLDGRSFILINDRDVLGFIDKDK